MRHHGDPMPKPAPCHPRDPRSSPARACGHPRGCHRGAFRAVAGSAGTACQGWAVSSGAWWPSWVPFRGQRRFLGELSPCGDFGTLARLFGDAGKQSHAGGDSPRFHSPVWFWGGPARRGPCVGWDPRQCLEAVGAGPGGCCSHPNPAGPRCRDPLAALGHPVAPAARDAPGMEEEPRESSRSLGMSLSAVTALIPRCSHGTGARP